LGTPTNQEIGDAARGRWTWKLSVAVLSFLLVETTTGLAVRFAPFHASVQWGLVAHTMVGCVFLLPVLWYTIRHWLDYRHQTLSDLVLIGYIGTAVLMLCLASGVVVTWQALFTVKTSALWRDVHLFSTFGVLGAALVHVVLAWQRTVRVQRAREARQGLGWSFLLGALATLLSFGLIGLYAGRSVNNAFPDDYNYLYGKDRPFAPSLARTASGGAIDSRSLAGSESCGTAGCHEQIVAEWKPSAHRYAAMDTVFLAIQDVMAKQNGAESTRYCAGCHDPISLFSGTKNIFVENLTSLAGYQEGISCLACHAIQKTDVQGNANYTIAQPTEYLWQWSTEGATRIVRDFLIRAYPAEHNKLSRRMFKTPEFCAACHKQFIDQEVNRVGWVQLQNQYDNWAASHWFTKGDPAKTVECRECHMPMVASQDPASGDAVDYNRHPRDRRHRSHRFLAANNFMPRVLNLEGGEEHARLTEEWLQGKFEIPEIRQKWAEGPIVRLAIRAPEEAVPGTAIPLRVTITSNKVGHDFPTGPLDMIQSWVHLEVKDGNGRVVFESGRRDDRNFLEPGTFLFKAEPVDQYGNLIDRHNLWEMVGVRYRRSLFPGYSDFVDYPVFCPSDLVPADSAPQSLRDGDALPFALRAPVQEGVLQVTARLLYRKIDQFLLNYVRGSEAGLTAPVVEITRATAVVPVRTRAVGGER
jgi:hypothetical protein